MNNSAKSYPAESSASVSTCSDETLPSGSRLSLEAVKSLAQKIAEGQIDPVQGAKEIVQEIDGLIRQVKQREASIYEWAESGSPS
jgi:hypothetical protein